MIRAYEHLKELEAVVGQYYRKKPARIVRQAEGSPNEYIGKIVADQPIPARIPIIIGDCIQNLHSSLDYLVRELVLAANQRPSKHNMFPICTHLHHIRVFRHATRSASARWSARQRDR